MSKRNYTHIQVLLPEIKAMQAEGKIQREIAEYYGFKDKQVVKELLKRERRKERKLEAGILPRPQGRPRKSNAPRDIVTEQAYEIRRRRRWQQMGQQLRKYENLLNRDFHAERPNRKWVTDISYIHTRQGVLYLSMIRDLYDNSIVAYKTGTEQSVNLVLDTIHLAIRREKKKVDAELQLHSDQGAQYASQAYFELTQQYGITPSMSRCGNPYDNAMAENFFSILKTECIYRHKPATFSEANDMIDRYIHFYNHERIQSKTGVAPLTLRHFC